MESIFCAKDDEGEIVQFWQVALKQCGFYDGAEDGDYGPATAAAVGAARKSVGSSVTDGLVIDAHAANQILIRFVRHWQTQPSAGPAGKDGAPGRDGAPGKDGAPGRDGTNGRDGMLILPETITLEAQIKPAS